MADAKIVVPLPGGTFELEGPEAFVNSQIDKFFDLIKEELTVARGAVKVASAVPSATKTSTQVAEATPGLDDIFAATENGVQILKDIPGNSKAERTINAAKLYLYGVGALKQRDTVFFEEVKEVCKAHGFYDGANMAANLKDEKEAFVFGGSGKKQTLKLTVPGSKSASKLIETLKAGSEE